MGDKDWFSYAIACVAGITREEGGGGGGRSEKKSLSFLLLFLTPLPPSLSPMQATYAAELSVT